MSKSTASGVSLVARYGFVAPEGDFNAGDLLEVSDPERVKFLIDGGYAARVTKTEAKEIAAGQADAPAA